MRMSLPKVAVLLTVLSLGVASAWAGSEADTAFLQGQKLLAGGDLRAALKQYVAAVKLDRDNQAVPAAVHAGAPSGCAAGRVGERDRSAEWEQSAVALRSFFSTQGLHAQALPLDRAMLERSKTADNAMQLAETLLALEQNEEAAEVLTSSDRQQATTCQPGAAGRRLGTTGQAGRSQGDCQQLQARSPGRSGTLYMMARMHAAVGNVDQALAALARCYEAVPPSRLDCLRVLRHANARIFPRSLRSLRSRP